MLEIFHERVAVLEEILALLREVPGADQRVLDACSDQVCKIPDDKEHVRHRALPQQRACFRKRSIRADAADRLDELRAKPFVHSIPQGRATARDHGLDLLGSTLCVIPARSVSVA